MEVKVTIKFKEAKEYQVEYLFFVGMQVYLDKPTVYPGMCVAYGLVEDNLVYDLDEIMFRRITEIRMIDIQTARVENWAAIEAITIESCDTDPYRYEMPKVLFSNYVMRDLFINETHLCISEKTYQALACYFRDQDILRNLKKAIYDYLEDDAVEDARKHLLKAVDSDPKSFIDVFRHVSDYTGEDELFYLNQILINQGGLCCYTMISNEGSADETKTEVMLFREQGEKVKEFICRRKKGDYSTSEHEGFLTDTYGDKIDLHYVDQIILKEENVEV